LKLNKYISNVLIHGDKRKFVIALVTLNFDEINRLAAENGITTRDHAQLIRQNVVKEVIRQAVADMNSQLASYESVKAFEILPEDFTIESGELTPSLKVRRKFCDKKYAALIDKLYGGDTGPEMSSAH
jgi:long-chain acyl-CoA synthetase